jgi:hypothetical protein
VASVGRSRASCTIGHAAGAVQLVVMDVETTVRAASRIGPTCDPIFCWVCSFN